MVRSSIYTGLSVMVGVLVLVAPVFAAAPKITEESVVDVSSTSATLRAKIDSEGESNVTYRFEYGTGQYSPAGEVSASVSAVGVSAHIQNLSPATAYHYRVVVQNHAKEVVAGEARYFTTRNAGGEFALPDGRAWEMVSPQNKRGAGIEPINEQGGLIQAAARGDAITYISIGSVEGEPAGNTAIEHSQIFSTRRNSGGWESRDIATPHNAISTFTPGYGTEYLFFSNDLAQGLVDPKGETPLPPLEEGAEKTIYVRNDATCASSSGTCFLPLVTKLNVRTGAVFGPTPAEGIGLQFAGATADLSHVVLTSTEALTTNAVKATENLRSLYEWADGKLQLVSILPSPNAVSTTAEGEEALLGYRGKRVSNAISDDGSRVVWEAGVSSKRHLYLRDVTKGETVQLDVPQAGVTPEPGEPSFEPIFQGASDNGSRVFFTDEQRLTSDSHAGLEPSRPDLYVFEINSGDGPLSGTLTDLTVDEKGSESAAVQGVVLGTSEDGTYVYFVANGALAERAITGNCEKNGTSGLCNLYMVHYDGTKWERPVLVAVLSNEDEAGWQNPGGNQGNLGVVTSRVSPDGEYLAFMSDRSLTGYDNRDATSGVPDEEVYLYHAMHGSTICASCDPTGARPTGVFDPLGMRPLLVDRVVAWGGHWLAGSVPGWTPVSLLEARYQSRYLSDSGRLFFDSPDTLVSADTNGEENVYEFEPVGVGSCSTASNSASEVFEPGADGCVALISSGGSSEESAFLDASESGGDVFFLTLQELNVDDVDSAFDVYDAHECTNLAPCVSAPVTSPPCTTAESCRGAPEAQPSIFGTGGSATLSGAGNLPSPMSNSSVGPRSATRTRKLARALRACKRVGRRQRRASCARRAERLYGRGK